MILYNFKFIVQCNVIHWYHSPILEKSQFLSDRQCQFLIGLTSYFSQIIYQLKLSLTKNVQKPNNDSESKLLK